MIKFKYDKLLIMPMVDVFSVLAVLALYVAAAGGFIPVGMHLLGRGKPEEVGANTFFLGIFQFLVVVFLFWMSIAQNSGVIAGVAFNVAVLAFIWLTLGLTWMRGWGLQPLGYHLLISTIMFIVLAVWYYTLPAYTLLVMNVTYAITVFSIYLLIIGKITNAKIPAFFLLFFGVVTVLIPAIALMFTTLP